MELGQVYVVEFENGKVKFGRSMRLEKRLRTLETQSGNIIVNRYATVSMANYGEVETLLKRKFKEKNVIGEYYDVDYEIACEYLKTLDYFIPTKQEIETYRIETEKNHDKIYENLKWGNEVSLKPKRVKNKYEVHCEYCQIPIGEYEPFEHDELDNDCELYSKFLDCKEESKTESNAIKKFKVICAIEGIKDFKGVYNLFKDINIDLGDWNFARLVKPSIVITSEEVKILEEPSIIEEDIKE